MKEAPFPNLVRELRVAAFLTREGLAARTADLATKMPTEFDAVSARSLERIEAGLTRPRAKIAAAIAKVFEEDPSIVFPLGADDPRRNPQGHTKVTPGRNAPGRAKKTRQ